MRRLFLLAVLATLPAALHAQFAEYYVGRDLLATIASGTYAGLPNPNLNRLTFLYAHTYPATPANNHYHSKGTYSYTGPNMGAGTAIIPFNSSNFLPEGAASPLPLLDGTGAFSGQHVTSLTPGLPFAAMRLLSVNSLTSAAPGTPEHILFTSSGNRWSGLLSNSVLNLRVVSLSTGLRVADAAGNILLGNVGDTVMIGTGESLDFTPIFVADPLLAPVGTNVSARLSLFDEGAGNAGNPWLDGGEFVFIFQVAAVPEPGTLTLCGSALVGGLSWQGLRRRQFTSVTAQRKRLITR